ncbi:hypothetical protein TNCV_4054891 [Trichonephila clavipes]|nr:hypothetical protein TNCV_4054891 [Trichonephila clavipes]
MIWRAALLHDCILQTTKTKADSGLDTVISRTVGQSGVDYKETMRCNYCSSDTEARIPFTGNKRPTRMTIFKLLCAERLTPFENFIENDASLFYPPLGQRVK